MKTNILTWFHYDNYGTVLQAYAMQYLISEIIDENCKLINYNPMIKHQRTKLEILSTKAFWKNKIDNFPYFAKHITKNGKENRSKEFEKFREKFLTVTEEVFTKTELNNCCNGVDAVICGSDQIWNTKNYDSTYFIDFLDKSKHKISLSPSFGVSKIDDVYKNEIKKYLNEFDMVSTREETGKNIINNLGIDDVKVTLDPTLLLNKQVWKQLSNITNHKKTDVKYILVYFLGNNKRYWKYVYAYAKKNKLELKIIPVHDKDYSRKGVISFGVGPLEFLNYISNAEICITDSFHCMIFSCLFEKKFLICDRFAKKDIYSQNSRIDDFIWKFGLEASRYDGSYNIKKPNYKLFEDKLNNYKKDSLEYINEIALLKKKSLYSFQICSTCCGCGVCRISCPRDAITINRDNRGFYSHMIDETKCIKCGLCKEVCSFNNINNLSKIENGELFKVKSINKSTVNKSTSGGVCFELAKFMNEQNCPVLGCTYDKNNRIAKHIIIYGNDIDGLNKINKSKYLQSNTIAFDYLTTLDEAVVIGLPCQISSLNNYLINNKKRNNYILIELICHGVPSYGLYEKYINENKMNIPSVDFRYKNDKSTWRKKSIKLEEGKNIKIIKSKNSNFYTLFELCKCLNESCYECNFRTNSGADLRIGDDWSDFSKNNKSGVNMVVCISKSGLDLLNELKNNKLVTIEKMEISNYFKFQRIINPIKPKNYNKIIDDLNTKEITLKEIINNNFLGDYRRMVAINLYSKLKK